MASEFPMSRMYRLAPTWLSHVIIDQCPHAPLTWISFARKSTVASQSRLHWPCFKAREAAIVRNLLEHGRCAVIVLGRGHDLSEEIRKQSGGRCEYLKVTPRNIPQPSTDWPPIRR